MVKWKTIDELREIFINKYVNSDLQSELEKACSEEYELKRDYNGRQILELLQNVDDACESSATSNKVAVKLSYKDNVLEVGNTGTSFSDETIERLCLGRASEKSIKKVGNKGTGFRSLLNDAEWIEVHSGQYSIRFSEKFTQQLFNSYCDKNCTLIDRQRKNWKKDYPFCFPIMNCPKEIEFNSKNFDTLIRVKVKKDNEVKAASIQKQLQQPFYKSLLFLPNISKIIIDTELAHKEYSKIIDNDSILIEEKFTDEKANKVEEYFAYRRKAPINNKEADLIIAIPKDTHYDFSKEKLYCYFPIRSFTTPIHALIHAPFLTNNSRDDVPDDNEEINRKLFLEILSFSKEISEKLARKNLSELALKTVMPLKESKLWRSDSFNLQDSYFKILSTAKIFKTVNEDLISINDYPKIFDFAFPKEFIGDDFKELLIYQDYTSTQFIKELSEFIQYTEFNYSAQDLLEKISKLSNKASIKIRVKLFLWWSEYYNSQYLPHLLKDANDTWILKDSKIYLPTDTGVSSLPKELSWVRLCILKQDYVSELIFQLKKTKKNEWKETLDDYRGASNKRILVAFSREHLAVTFIEQSSSDLIESTINQQIDSLDKSKSFINWLFEKYSKNLQEGTELSIIKSLQLPDRDKNIRPINKLYLGEDYDNALAEKLFQNTDIKPFIQLEDIYNGTEKYVFLSFLKKCGIQEYPEIIKESLSDKDKFKDYVSQHYVTDIKINYLHSYAVKNFENLISTLSTDEIVEWLSRDFKLNNFIISEEKDSYAQYGNSKRFFPSNAYIKFILNTSPWIELAGKKYPPCKIIKYGKLKDSVEGYYGISEQELIKKLGEDIVKKFGFDFKDSIAQLPDKDIKIFLDALPDFDSGEISRKLYLDIIKYKKDKKPAYSPTNIKLLCKDGKFYPNDTIKYADRKIPKTDEDSGKFIHIPTKQSIVTIKTWLGVDRYETNLKLDRYELFDSEFHCDFQKAFDTEIRNIKNAILCIIDDNDNNISNLKQIKIFPCKKIEVSDLEQENKKTFLEDYFYVENKKDFYIKLPAVDSIATLRQSYEFALSLADLFKQALTLDLNSDLLQLLISQDTDRKQHIISERYGIDKWKQASELLFKRDTINKQIYNFFSENGLKAQLLNKIASTDFTIQLSDTDYKNLIQALKEISKDIIDLNACSETLNIDLIPFFRRKIKGLITSNYEKYRLNVYTELQKSGKYSQFLDKLEEYKNFDISKFKLKNSIVMNNDKILMELLIKEFPALKNKNTENIDPNKIYNDNVKKITSKSGITEDDFDFFIQTHENHKPVFYFKIPETIYDEISKFLSNEDNIDNEVSCTIETEIKTSTITTKLRKSENGRSENYTKCGALERSTEEYKKKNTRNEQSGKRAETIAFNELKKSFPKLIWHSKYSMIPADRNTPPPGGVICDMWDQASNTYFEVKSAAKEFEMSINEYESMKNNQDNYEVVLVNTNTLEISRHTFAELDEFKQINGYKFIFEQKKLS